MGHAVSGFADQATMPTHLSDGDRAICPWRVG